MFSRDPNTVLPFILVYIITKTKVIRENYKIGWNRNWKTNQYQNREKDTKNDWKTINRSTEQVALTKMIYLCYHVIKWKKFSNKIYIGRIPYNLKYPASSLNYFRKFYRRKTISDNWPLLSTPEISTLLGSSITTTRTQRTFSFERPLRLYFSGLWSSTQQNFNNSIKFISK